MELLSWININNLKWAFLSENPNAIHLLEENPEKIDWKYLSENPNAIHLLEANQEKIDWYNFSLNPNIFEFGGCLLK
jgi:hypothetical protein